VGKGGILRDEAVRRATVERVVGELGALGLEPLATFDSPVPGAGGNREAFALLRRRR
jgi:23S rRNA (cytidine1920-2'-O)/16S rRNA (cytidine1409-2'-O)-methyltransferase